jgi:hypothetical protein
LVPRSVAMFVMAVSMPKLGSGAVVAGLAHG